MSCKKCGGKGAAGKKAGKVKAAAKNMKSAKANPMAALKFK
jgi:hypothetical protein